MVINLATARCCISTFMKRLQCFAHYPSTGSQARSEVADAAGGGYMQSAKRALIGITLLGTTLGFAGSLAAQANKEISSTANATREIRSPSEAQLRAAWQKTMRHKRTPKAGCFEGSYPSTEWKEISCAPPPGWRSTRPRRRRPGRVEVGGTGG